MKQSSGVGEYQQFQNFQPQIQYQVDPYERQAHISLLLYKISFQKIRIINFYFY